MNEIVPSLIAQGVGGLVLGLACVVLCLVRPRHYFVWWTVAGVCFALWLLLRGLLLGWVATPPAWLPNLLAVCGWWHLTAWTFGLLDYVRGQGPAPRPGRAPAQLPLGLCLAAFVAVACCAVLLAGALSWPAQRAVLCGTQAGVFAASAVVFARAARRTGRLGAILPAVFLAAFALDRAADLGFLPEPSPDETPSISVLALSLRTFLLQTATTAGLIVLMFDEEKIALRSALDQLADSEDRFRLVFEHSGVGMALLAPDGRIVKANPALLRFLGYPSETLLNRRLADLTHPEDDTGQRRLSRPSDEDSALYEREKRFVHHTGETVWAKVLRVPVRDAAGHLRYHVGVLVDITERKRAEMALAASELRYRLRFEHALDGMFLWDETGRLADVNPAFCRMLGTTRDELLGRALADVTPEPEAFADASLAAVGQGGGKTETRLRRNGGALIDVEMSVAATGGEGGRLFHASCRDITDRKRAEEALRDERDFSTRILDTAEALILVLDAAGRVRRFNGKCAAVSGYREDEVRGRFLWDVLTPAAEVEAVRELFTRMAHGEEPPSRPTESVWLTRQGGERLIAWRYATVRDASSGSGGVRHVIGTGLDITDERRLQEQLRQAQKMELLGTLVGGLAHDFNNHLTAILGNLDAVLEPSPSEEALSPEKTRQHLTDARRGGQLCAAMTQGLLDFSRRRTGRRVPVDLNRVVQDSLSLLRNGLPKIIAINVTTEPGLWPVSADATQIHQVIMNLAVNARDAMISKLGGEEMAAPELRTPSSSFLLTVRTRNRVLTEADCRAQVEARPGRFVELSVEDTGCGMPPEVLARIFEPFFTTKEVGRGTGLGLPMVFGIVKGHGGWLAVESVVGRGSLFRIYLPASDVPAAEPQHPPTPAPVVRTNGSAGKRRVLVVDDEDLVRDLAKSVLERGGFRVLAASDGTQAIEVYRGNLRPDGGSDIDVVLLDYTMPRMTGLQVLEELRLMNPSVRVIFSSGYALDGDAGPLLDSGALAFVAKPYRPQDLVAAVRAAVES